MLKTRPTANKSKESRSAEFLKTLLVERAKKNPSYSLRAFAAKLSISPSGLSQILSGKKRLSLDRAHTIVRNLGLASPESEKFLLLVQIDAAKDHEVKLELLGRLNGNKTPIDEGHQLTLDQFKLMSEWYGPAIAVYISYHSIPVHRATVTLSSIFGLTAMEVSAMLDRLERLELITKTKQNGETFYTKNEDRLYVESQAPSEAIRRYYRQVIKKAEAAVDSQTPQEKAIGTEVLGFDPEQLPEIKKITNTFFNNLIELSEKSKSKKVLYQTFASVFRLNSKEKT